MKEIRLRCFSGFACLADTCPDTCCAGWEVDLDEETVRRYRAMPGKLGEELRANLSEENGEVFFAMREGRCPFLNETGLCRLILARGDGILSDTCREHPRIWEDYGDTREICLSISCPEAARLLFEGEPGLTVTETAEQAMPDPELDTEFLAELRLLRRALLRLAASSRPLTEKLALVLDIAEHGLLLPEDGAMETMWDSVSAQPLFLDLCGFARAMAGMRFTRPRLPALLSRLPAAADDQSAFFTGAEREQAGGRLLFYFLYRYLLRGVWSGLVSDKLRFAAYAAGTVLALAEVMPGDDTMSKIRVAAADFSREVEHDPDNLNLLFDYLCADSDG